MSLIKPKYIIGLFGTIALGVVSSALWDGIKPLSKFLYEKTLYVSVLGIEGYKDGIYQDIAKGHHENVSLEIFIVINSILLSFVIVVLLISSVKYLYRNGDDEIADRIINVLHWPKTLNRRSFLVFIFFYAIFSLTIFSLNLVKTKYINQAVTYYEQLVEITTPYIESEEIEKINSQFAQIENKSDFVSVIDRLRTVVQENELNEPEFNFIF